MDTSEAVSAPRLRLIFAGLMLAMGLAQLDQSIVAPALPEITRDFGALTQLAWVVSAFMLTSTVSMPVYGRLGDMHGRKRVLLAALGIFLVGSVLCAAVDGMTGLILARALQGLGAGGMVTQVQASIGDLVPPRRRAYYQGLFMSVFAACGICGPALGGIITQLLSWRWIFLLNVPLAIAAGALLLAAMPDRSSDRRHPIDYIGAVLIAGASACLMSLLSWDWSDRRNVLSGVFCAAAMVAMVVTLIRTQKTTAHPLLPVQLLTHGPYLSALIVTICGALALFGAMVFLPSYFQSAFRVSAAASGSMLIPFTAGLLLATMVSAILTRRGLSSRVQLVAGLIIALGADIAMSLLIELEGGVLAIEIALLLIGVGNGLFMPGAIALVQQAAAPAVLGVATATATFFRSLGGAVGVALAGGLMSFFMRAAHELPGDGAAVALQFDLQAYRSGLAAVFVLSAVLIGMALAVERLLLRTARHESAATSENLGT